jgi:hypothetical protein
MPKRKHPNKSRQPPNKRNVRYSQELPQFLDAESSITASRFGARRLVEMKTLWLSFLQNSTTVNHDDEAYYQSGGCKLSKRHLRRRTGSHHRRKRHRFPTGIGEIEETTTTTTMMLSKEKDDDCHSPCQDEHGDDNNKKKKNNFTGVKEMSRRARRKPPLLKMKNGQWKHIGGGGGETNWLETHLWHSKRFYISAPLSIYNNWCIPLGHTNRGSRAAIRLSESKSTIQDATWSISGKCIMVQAEKQQDLIDFVEKVCGKSRFLSASFLTNDRVIQGLEVGYGCIYDVDCVFPAGLLAPAFFIFGGHVSTMSQCYFVRIFIQGGSIVDKVENMLLKEVVVEGMGDGPDQQDSSLQLTKEAMCWIRVRGVQATQVIRKSLQLEREDEKMDRLWKWWSNEDSEHSWRNLHTLLPHGTVMRMTCNNVKQQTHHHPQQDMNDDIVELEDDEMDDIIERIVNRNQFDLTDNVLPEHDILLISQMPCAIDSMALRHNNSVSGWDILCKPSQTCRIFSALNNVGGACAIGFIEDAAMNIEAEPPLPVWPRDFPDTIAGKQYWSGEHGEWRLLRYCIEQGIAGGRLKTGLRRLLNKCSLSKESSGEEAKPTTQSRKLIQKSIDWVTLCVGSDDTSQDSDSTTGKLEQHSVVVRGTLNTPFVQALCGFGKQYFDTVFQNTLETNEENVKKRNRPRRKVRGKDTSVTVPPLDKVLMEEHQTFCSKLLKSLTLPALLRCHLVAESKGSMNPGMIIGFNTSIQKDSNTMINTVQTLGYVVSGGFSQSRGRVHGVGFISAKTFLSILTGSSYVGQYVVVSREDQKTIGLKVTLQSHDDIKGIMIQSMTASLTILL